MTSSLALNAATYVTIGLAIYYFIRELLNTKNQKWLTWIFIALIIGFVAFIIWNSYRGDKILEDEVNEYFSNDKLYDNSQKGGDFDATSKSSESEHHEFLIPENYHKRRLNFSLADGAINEDSQIKYNDFKQWYLTPDFLEKYTNAIRDALKIKFKRLLNLRTQCVRDLKTLKNKGKEDEGIANILQTLDKSQDTKMIESTILEIDNLLGEIKSKTRDLNVNVTRKCLISALTDKKNGIDSLIGRENIKDFLALQLYTFAQNPRIFFSNFQNMAIYGSSGVGKTKLAQVIGHVYASSGILVKNHVHVITKQSLTTAYVNESARITRKLLMANLEGVVFIDEAYDMTPPADFLGRSIDHGHEAVTEIVNFIDKMIGLSIIIVAGYEKPMESRFMKANEGLPRRFPHKLVLKPYSAKELTSILIRFILETCPDLDLNEIHGDFLYTAISYIISKNPTVFENQAGDMANLGAFIARAVYGTPDKDWEANSEEIMISGINAFLARKDICLTST